nr:unnamed protein product [Callosobruchus chinensis]
MSAFPYHKSTNLIKHHLRINKEEAKKCCEGINGRDIYSLGGFPKGMDQRVTFFKSLSHLLALKIKKIENYASKCDIVLRNLVYLLSWRYNGMIRRRLASWTSRRHINTGPFAASALECDEALELPEPLRCSPVLSIFSGLLDFSFDVVGLGFSSLLPGLPLLVLIDLLELSSTLELLCSALLCELEEFRNSFSLELVVNELLPESTDCSLLDDNLDDPALELLDLSDITPTVQDFVPDESSTLSFPEVSEALTSCLEIFALSEEDLSRGVLKVDPSLTVSFGAFVGESVLNFASELSIEGTLLKVELLLSLLFGIISVLSRTSNTNDNGHYLGNDEITKLQGEQLSNLMRGIQFNGGIGDCRRD